MGHDLANIPLPPSTPSVNYGGQTQQAPGGESPLAAHAVPPETARSPGTAANPTTTVGNVEVRSKSKPVREKTVEDALFQAKEATQKLVDWTDKLPPIVKATDSKDFRKLAPELKDINDLAKVAHSKVSGLDPEDLDTTSVHTALDTVGLLVKKTNEIYAKVQTIPVSEVKKKNFFTALSAILGAAATATAALLAAPLVLGVSIIAPPIGIALAGALAVGFVLSLVARHQYNPQLQRDVQQQVDRASVDQLAPLFESHLDLYRVLIASVAADASPKPAEIDLDIQNEESHENPV